EKSEMKLHATIAGLEMNVEIRRNGGRVFANVDGREYELEVHQSAASVMVRTADGKVFDSRVEGKPSLGQSVDVFVGPRQYPVTLTDPKRLRGAAAAGGQADGIARIIAPMPGKIVRVLVEPGAQLEAGMGVIVVEAMKMQNEMKAPKAGVVTAINVRVGATVNGGDVLAVIE
ncbi:MAG TPA: biotin/lipoyl-containing protein, partial [Pyrinomonadaceae bacterium]|nr:biotin/lipoyl-containing protein [Pyrinomonadaceae bacterium]